MKAIALAAMALPMIAAPALAGPYVESKTTAAGTISDGGSYKGAQTEVRGLSIAYTLGASFTILGALLFALFSV